MTQNEIQPQGDLGEGFTKQTSQSEGSIPSSDCRDSRGKRQSSSVGSLRRQGPRKAQVLRIERLRPAFWAQWSPESIRGKIWAFYRDFKGLDKKPIQKNPTIKPPCPVGLQLGRSKPWLWGCHHTMPGHPEAQDGETPPPPPQEAASCWGCVWAALLPGYIGDGCFQISQLSGRCWAFIWGLVEHGSRCLMTLLWQLQGSGMRAPEG